ncbi:telomere zinc finger-associated protein isoform X3 [Mustela nigripes]|uniref:telomere zinc finger-associated protein isoform X3 n=1 Tax=Mustela nigripes TaxID=77151 RepID=UPI002815F95D|nr:telomere zinc finger-associated protein isoform X3 [Mustela nigripes]
MARLHEAEGVEARRSGRVLAVVVMAKPTEVEADCAVSLGSLDPGVISVVRCWPAGPVWLCRALHVQPCGLPCGGGLLGAPVWLRQSGLTKPSGESWLGLLFLCCGAQHCWWGSRRGAGRGSGGESLRPHTLCAFSWQETHWGETLRVSQMWKVLLSEGEPRGARSPELHEPLRTASPPSGRLLPAASGSPGRGCRRRQRPPPDAGPACPSHCQVFTCSVCQETFRRRMELRVHMVSHTGEMPYKCSSCSQQFMQKKDLQSHLIKLHGAPKPHACPTCAKCFLSRTELQLHEAFKHRGEKLFVCEECGHRASSRNGLQMHIKAKHRNERPYVCEFCSHAFTQKANLNMHLRTHTGEKPFQCHLCGKTFRTQASLDKHNRTHTGERPFSCEFCEQRFTEKGPLLRHVASRHQEGRPHFCQICGKTFKAVEQLRVHVRRHKGVRKFECTECGYKFTRQAHLRRHMEIHDRVENYNPRQRKLRNLVIEDEKMVVVALQPPAELEVGSAEVIVASLAQGGLASQLPGQRLCAEESLGSPSVMEPSLIITAAIPEDCDT